MKLVEEALARGGKSLADATEEEVNVVIESFDSQRSQTHILDIGAMVSYIFTYRDSRTIRML